MANLLQKTFSKNAAFTLTEGAARVDTCINTRRAAFTLAEAATQVDICHNNRRTAFTLAEVLITLGIIGIVAALTIPNMVSKYKHKALETSFKKAYSVLSQATERMTLDLGAPPSKDYLTRSEFNKYIRKYFNVNADCSNSASVSTGCFDANKSFGSWLDTEYKTYNGKSAASSLHWYFDDGMFTLSDGMILFIDSSTSENYLLGVDTNGLKKPNQLGHDLFLFTVDKNKGTLIPYETGLCDKTSSNGLNGLSCAVDALENPDEYFKNLP